jgi:ribosome maturation factor RimP
MADGPVLERVRALVAPIASDLRLDLYDIEQRGGTLRVTLDSLPESEAGIDLEQLALATRLISRELDHHDPVPGKYTLEVSSPGIERPLRRPEHFARVVGQRVSVRLVAPDSAGQRRFDGTLTQADATTITIVSDTGTAALPIAQVERAKTVFDWSPAPKPGGRKPKPTPAPTIGDEPDDDAQDAEFEGEFDDEFDDAMIDDIDEEETETS